MESLRPNRKVIYSIRKAMWEKKIKRPELAKLCGMSITKMVCIMEEKTEPSLKDLRIIARKLGKQIKITIE